MTKALRLRGDGHRGVSLDARPPAGPQATLSVARSRLERGDLVRLVREPAGDRATEDRHNADEQHRDERDEQAVLGDRDTLIGLDELTNQRADAIHWGPLIESVILH